MGPEGYRGPDDEIGLVLEWLTEFKTILELNVLVLNRWVLLDQAHTQINVNQRSIFIMFEKYFKVWTEWLTI